jgi:hypothetical protein
MLPPGNALMDLVQVLRAWVVAQRPSPTMRPGSCEGARLNYLPPAAGPQKCGRAPLAYVVQTRACLRVRVGCGMEGRGQ